MRILPLFVLAVAACGGHQRIPRRPMDVDAHLAEARRHDEAAARHDQLASEAERAGSTGGDLCGDPVLADQVTSGGQPIHIAPTCWILPVQDAARHRIDAARERADASIHRSTAAALLDTEQAACALVPAAQRDHSPFADHAQIASVVAELDGDIVRGARIRFRPTARVSASALVSAISCHRATAAANAEEPAFLRDDPTVVASTRVDVLDDPAGLTVVVSSTDDAAALVVYARAEALLGAGWQ